MSVEHASLTRRPFKPKEHGKSGMGVVDPLGGQQKRPQLRSVKAASVIGVALGRRRYCAGLEAIRPSMWAKR